MVNNRKSNGNLVQFQRKKSSTCFTSEASQNVSNQEYDMRQNEINQINNNHFTTLSRQNSSTNYDMDADLKESILETESRPMNIIFIGLFAGFLLNFSFFFENFCIMT